MAEMQTLARPYARAAFAAAQEAQQLAEWGAALERFAAAVADDSMAALIGHPGVEAADLVDMLLQAADAGSLSGCENFLKILAENKRLAALPAVAEEFAALRAAFEQLCHVGVRSAADLDAAQQDRFTAALRQRLGADVSVEWAVDPELIGGAIVSAGDLVIDGSVQGELARLRAGLSQ